VVLILLAPLRLLFNLINQIFSSLSSSTPTTTLAIQLCPLYSELFKVFYTALNYSDISIIPSNENNIPFSLSTTHSQTQTTSIKINSMAPPSLMVEGQKLNIIYSLVSFFQFHNCIFLNQFEK
jgi:hypothetical protein